MIIGAYNPRNDNIQIVHTGVHAYSQGSGAVQRLDFLFFILHSEYDKRGRGNRKIKSFKYGALKIEK